MMKTLKCTGMQMIDKLNKYVTNPDESDEDKTMGKRREKIESLEKVIKN